MQRTNWRNLRTYSDGEEDWDHTDVVQDVDADLPVRGALADRPTSAPEGALYRAEDARLLYRYDPTNSRADTDGWVVVAGLGVDTQPVPGTLFLQDLSVAGTSTGLDHRDLGGVQSDQHHARYTNEEAQDAVGGMAGNALVYDDATPALNVDEAGISHDNIAGVSTSDHHTRYADTEARSAVTGNVDAADLTSANATAADQAPLSDGAGGLTWTYITQGLYDNGQPVILSEYSGPGLTVTTTNTTYTDPSAWADRGIIDWNQLHYLDTNGILTNWRARWGVYRAHETTSGQTATFRLASYGTAEVPYSDGRTEFSVTNTNGPLYRPTTQFSIGNLSNFGVWTPTVQLKTDGGEARSDGAVFLQLKADVA